MEGNLSITTSDVLSEKKCVDLTQNFKKYDQKNREVEIVVKTNQISVSNIDTKYLLSVDLAYYADLP